MEDQCVITREITVADGVFAPGHLGELTQIVPFEMVDAALATTGTTQAWVRVLPARVVVYLRLVAFAIDDGHRWRRFLVLMLLVMAAAAVWWALADGGVHVLMHDFSAACARGHPAGSAG